MRKVSLTWIGVMILFLLTFGGCMGKEKKENDDGLKSSVDGHEGLFFAEDLKWKDNSLDVYSAAFIMPMKKTEPENSVGGINQYVLGKEGACILSKHYFEELSDNWDELKTFADNGTETSHRLNFWEGNNQAWVVGSIYDSDHYLMMNVEPGDDERLLYVFFETDESVNIVNSFYLSGLDEKKYEIPSQMMVDKSGNVHVVVTDVSDHLARYYVASPSDGKLMEAYKEDSQGIYPKLFYLKDGRVGLCSGSKLMTVNGSGTMDVLATAKGDFLKCILLDENTLLYADGTGLYERNLIGGEPELLYLWENHGLRIHKVIELQCMGNQEIRMLYETQEGVEYIKLKPTTEQVSVTEIEFAVSSSAKTKYEGIVANFNKKYPACHVKLEEYAFSDNRLLTKLMAGEGPQLLDTFLTGFEDHADWWEPLDDFYSNLGLDQKLIPQTMEYAKIDGKYYGVVPDFFLQTMISFDESLEGWDYETFLDYLCGNASKAIFNPVNGSDGYSFATLFLHDLSQTFLYNADTGTTNFDGEAFQKILNLADRYEKAENQGDAEDFRAGNSPCAVVSICEPADLALLRIWGENQLHYVGYPAQTGSVTYLMGAEPLCVRANADVEEKRLALTFLNFLLSYDTQRNAVITEKALNFNMSARKDVLEEEIKEMNGDSMPFINGFPQIPLGDKVDVATDSHTLSKLLENAVPKRYAPKELSKIWMEEVGGYLEGSITRKALTEHLTNRVKLYLKENN